MGGGGRIRIVQTQETASWYGRSWMDKGKDHEVELKVEAGRGHLELPETPQGVMFYSHHISTRAQKGGEGEREGQIAMSFLGHDSNCGFYF